MQEFKAYNGDGKFGAVVYYPFEQAALERRLRSPYIDVVVFSGDSPESIELAVRKLLRELELLAA